MIHARNFASRVPGARLVGLADPLEDSLAAAREEVELEFIHTDVQDALRNPAVEAVVVATPTVAHRDIVIAAAEAGKHILCEKPMAMNVPECDAMIEAVEANGVKLQIGFMRRFDSEFLAAKQRIDAGEIGDVVLVILASLYPSMGLREIRITGGGERSDLWNRIKAAVLEMPVVRIAGGGGARMGSAMLAGYGVGIFKSLPSVADRWVRKGTRFPVTCTMARTYSGMVERYEALLDTLSSFEEESSRH